MKTNSLVLINNNEQYFIEDTLNKQTQEISKTVPAKTLFTDGNSIHEWGYQP